MLPRSALTAVPRSLRSPSVSCGHFWAGDTFTFAPTARKFWGFPTGRASGWARNNRESVRFFLSGHDIEDKGIVGINLPELDLYFCLSRPLIVSHVAQIQAVSLSRFKKMNTSMVTSIQGFLRSGSLTISFSNSVIDYSST